MGPSITILLSGTNPAGFHFDKVRQRNLNIRIFILQYSNLKTVFWPISQSIPISWSKIFQKKIKRKCHLFTTVRSKSFERKARKFWWKYAKSTTHRNGNFFLKNENKHYSKGGIFVYICKGEKSNFFLFWFCWLFDFCRNAITELFYSVFWFLF